MPDKRQTSKQRRAARNRAYREAMIARRENATAEREQARQARASRAGGSAGRSTAGAATAATAAPVRPQWPIVRPLYGRPAAPGDNAVFVALVAAVVFAAVAVIMAFTSKVIPVDHAGDALTGPFPAVTRQAYAVAHDTEPATGTVTVVDAFGPIIPIFALLPVVIVAVAFVSHRRAARSRPLTYSLVALALISVFNGGFAMYFLPALIALAVAGFQVRKTEVPARTAGRAADRDERDDEDDVIDVEEVEPDEDVEDIDDLEDEDLDEDVDDTVAEEDTPDDDAERDDVLAELESEIEDEPDDEAETGRGGRGRGPGGRSARR